MNFDNRLRRLERMVSQRELEAATPPKLDFHEAFEYRNGFLVVREDFPERFPQEFAEWEARCNEPDPIEAAIEAVEKGEGQPPCAEE